MFAVLFRARIKQSDPAYLQTAQRLRELALTRYGCVEFTALTEGDTEIAISYWEDEAQIHARKQDAEHRVVQAHGRDAWYAAYRVQVVKVLREYAFP